MLADIKHAYLNGRLMLLLGAGASFGSRDSLNRTLPMGADLSKELAELVGWSYNDEPLGNVYSAVNNFAGAQLRSHLQSRLINTKPSQELRALASFPWARIFTLNIDDCTETALRMAGTQKVQVFARNSTLAEIDPLFASVQLIKLNGSADRLEDGLIFSPQEYGEGSSRLPTWYRELGQNHSNYTFVFIGSKLNEPIFQQVMAEMRQTVTREPQMGYVVTPYASEIDQRHLESLKLRYVPGTLKDFVDWLCREIPKPPTGWDLATARRPELRNISEKLTERKQRALHSVTLVNDEALKRIKSSSVAGKIRDFYRGYKPSWVDILDGVPAELGFITKFSKLIQESDKSEKCIALVGPAGSGKSTALMIAALKLSRSSNLPVYFLREAINKLKEIVIDLEEMNSSRFFLFIDKIEAMHEEVAEILSDQITRNVCIVTSERLNIWKRRVGPTIGPLVGKEVRAEKITRTDADLILTKLERFGPWTRFQQMTPEQRIVEVFKKADRQLLIGLMEATTGVGFTKIIAEDFNRVGDYPHKAFLVIVSLASFHRSTLSSNIVGAALSNLGIQEDVNLLSRDAEGIVVSNSSKYSARHPVYVQELLEKIVPTSMIKDCMIATLEAFSDYETPVIKHIRKADGVVFKSIMNHRFINHILRSDEEKVLSVYETFETKFHIDGLYWLQYGLALRGFNRQHDALEKLKTARQAYISPQIEHAYAQQLMIIARESSTWVEAEPMLTEAVDILSDLDSKANTTDAYPIVTLAEGHISVGRKFLRSETTRKIAQRYANSMLAIHNKNPDRRIEEAAKNITTFLTSGSWKALSEPDYFARQ